MCSAILTFSVLNVSAADYNYSDDETPREDSYEVNGDDEIPTHGAVREANTRKDGYKSNQFIV